MFYNNKFHFPIAAVFYRCNVHTTWLMYLSLSQPNSVLAYRAVSMDHSVVENIQRAHCSAVIVQYFVRASLCRCIVHRVSILQFGNSTNTTICVGRIVKYTLVHCYVLLNVSEPILFKYFLLVYVIFRCYRNSVLKPIQYIKTNLLSILTRKSEHTP